METNKNVKIRGFEVVTDSKRKHPGVDIELPTLGTEKAMACDFYSPVDLTIEVGKIGKIWSDVKAYMGDNEGLILNVRSSQGGKVALANTQGWIDGDYYENESNDGNIGIFLKNIGNEPYVIKKGDKIAQGAFFPVLKPDGIVSNNKRVGGFGSTGR